MRGITPNGEQIRRARVALGLSQEQLAARADVDVKTIRKAEHGGRIDAQTVTALTAALGIDPEALIRSSNPLQERRRQVVEQWVQAWDANDIDMVLSLYDPQAVMHLPGSPEIPFSGRFAGLAEIRRGHELAWKSATTAPLQANDSTIELSGDTVILDATKGVQLPDGRLSYLSCVQIFRFTGEQIIEHRVEYDTLAMQRLIGKPPASRNNRQSP